MMTRSHLQRKRLITTTNVGGNCTIIGTAVAIDITEMSRSAGKNCSEVYEDDSRQNK